MTTLTPAPLDLVIQAPALSADQRHAFQTMLPDRQRLDQASAARFLNLSVDETQGRQLFDLGAATGCDVALVPGWLTASHVRVLVMDMDSTVITMECIDELAAMAGKGPEVSAITEAAMRGEITDFSESLRRRVKLLEGAPANIIQRVLSERLAYSPGARTLLDHAARHQWHRVLVSGGFHAFADVVGSTLGFNTVCANHLVTHHDRFTGEVLGSPANGGGIVDARCKADQLQLACQQLACRPDQAIAIGDGANDLMMMAAAGWSVAYHAKPRVRAQASCALDQMGLDGVLPLLKDSWTR
jgi:phosphoserine phosphatase